MTPERFEQRHRLLNEAERLVKYSARLLALATINMLLAGSAVLALVVYTVVHQQFWLIVVIPGVYWLIDWVHNGNIRKVQANHAEIDKILKEVRRSWTD